METLHKWHKTRVGHLVFGLVELGLSYLLASAALGSGDWWEWLLAFIFLFGTLQNFGRMLVVHTK